MEDSEFEFDNDIVDSSDHSTEEVEEDNDLEEEEQGISEEDRGENGREEVEAQKVNEMEQLEKEYREFTNEQQNIWRNLKDHKDEELQKGQAVKNQRALWDKTLEIRFLLQKPFSSSNRLPQEPFRSLFCETDNEVSEAYSDLIASSKNTLNAILGLQQALVANNPKIAQSGEGMLVRELHEVSTESQNNIEHLIGVYSLRLSHLLVSLANPHQHINGIEASGNLNEDMDEEWMEISQTQSRMASFRNKSIDQWQRKTQVTTGAAAIKDKLHAFNQNISEQVAAYMRDPCKMVKGMQQNRSAVAMFGNVRNPNEGVKPEESHANGDPELLDDAEFYQQLLKEFFETIDPSSSETAFYAMKRLKTKKRKIVDRRASKSRKIRYNVHDKIVNFMAPRPMILPPMAPKLFENLFGHKTTPATGA